MTEQEIIAVKKYCEGAYPLMKSNDDSDLVWFDMLQDQEYYGILQSVKNHIKSGNKYPPTLAEIISGYDLLVMQFSNDVLRLMEESGYFNDPDNADEEMAEWNKQNRIHKARMFLSNGYPKEGIPEWFKEDYQKFEKMIKARYFATSTVKRLEA